MDWEALRKVIYPIETQQVTARQVDIIEASLLLLDEGKESFTVNDVLKKMNEMGYMELFVKGSKVMSKEYYRRRHTKKLIETLVKFGVYRKDNDKYRLNEKF